MITSISSFRLYTSKDLESQGLRNKVISFLIRPVYRFTYLLRLNEFLINTKWPLIFIIIPRVWFRKLSIKLGFSIPFNTCDYGLGIVHYGLIVINGDARLGKNTRIHCGVNIGASAGFKAKGDTKSYAPTIGDNCYIGPGAKLFGPITIGNNCVVGANAVVNKSFLEDGSVIVGIPAKKISNSGSENLVPNLMTLDS